VTAAVDSNVWAAIIVILGTITMGIGSWILLTLVSILSKLAAIEERLNDLETKMRNLETKAQGDERRDRWTTKGW
jgi:hypothetical protein